MSYGIVRVQKFTAGSVKGIEIHDKREKEKSNTNPDIDYSKSQDNYDLHDSNKSFQQAIKERISQLELKRAVRKDAVVMAQVLVTSDGLFFENLDKLTQEGYADATHRAYASGMPFTQSLINSEVTDYSKEFFKDAYMFLSERYGADNVVSATVHLDEKTPHMHFNFVPVTADGRLSAKDVLSKKNLIEQQTAFYEQVGKKYGLLRGEPKENGKERKHLETAEYKAKTQQLDDINKKIVEAQNRLDKVEKAVTDTTERRNALEGKIEVLEATVEQLEDDKEVMTKTINELENKGVKFGADWERVYKARAAENNRVKDLEKKARVLDIIIDMVPNIRPLIQQLLNERNLKKKEKER